MLECCGHWLHPPCRFRPKDLLLSFVSYTYNTEARVLQLVSERQPVWNAGRSAPALTLGKTGPPYYSRKTQVALAFASHRPGSLHFLKGYRGA
jgi:hypothetical protein